MSHSDFESFESFKTNLVHVEISSFFKKCLGNTKHSTRMFLDFVFLTFRDGPGPPFDRPPIHALLLVRGNAWHFFARSALLHRCGTGTTHACLQDLLPKD